MTKEEREAIRMMTTVIPKIKVSVVSRVLDALDAAELRIEELEKEIEKLKKIERDRWESATKAFGPKPVKGTTEQEF